MNRSIYLKDGMAVARAVYEEGDSIGVTLLHFADILTVPVTRMNVAERIYLMMLSERLLEELMYQQPPINSCWPVSTSTIKTT